MVALEGAEEAMAMVDVEDTDLGGKQGLDESRGQKEVMEDIDDPLGVVIAELTVGDITKPTIVKGLG